MFVTTSEQEESFWKSGVRREFDFSVMGLFPFRKEIVLALNLVCEKDVCLSEKTPRVFKFGCGPWIVDVEVTEDRVSSRQESNYFSATVHGRGAFVLTEISGTTGDRNGHKVHQAIKAEISGAMGLATTQVRISYQGSPYYDGNPDIA